jgi:glutathione reductase (NADPH)
MADHRLRLRPLHHRRRLGRGARERLSAMLGHKVAVAEEHRPGGTCVIRGCVPKKFMVYASNYAKTFKQAQSAMAGMWAEKPVFDWPSFRDAMNAEVDRLSGIYARNLGNTGVELIEDRAVLEGPHTVRLVKSGPCRSPPSISSSR